MTTRSYIYVDRRFGKVFVIPAFLEYVVLEYGESLIDMSDEDLQNIIDAGECGESCTMDELKKLQSFVKKNKKYHFTEASRVFEVKNRFALCDGEYTSDWDTQDMDVDFLCDSNIRIAYLPSVYIFARR